MASTVADDGAEECSCSDCKILTTKRFKCIAGHRVWMCRSCHKDHPVCSLCSAEEEDYKTDTDLDSRPDSSVSFEELPLVELHEEVATGEYEEALNAVAGITLGDKKQDTLRDSRKATRTSEGLFLKCSTEICLPTPSAQLHLEVKSLRLNVTLNTLNGGHSSMSWVYSDFEVIKLDHAHVIRKTESVFGVPQHFL